MQGYPPPSNSRGPGVVAVLQLVVSLLTLGVLVVLFVRVLVATAPAPDAARASLDQMKYSAYTNGEAAHITVTNTATATEWGCFEGVVTSKKTNGSAMTVAICTGDMKPHTSVALEAPYKVGAVEDLCGETVGEGVFQRKSINWDLCDFTVINSPP